MLDFENAELTKVILHKTGCKARQEDLVFSDGELKIYGAVKEMLKGYFLNHFQEEAAYNFNTSQVDKNNEVYDCVKEIFNNPDSFVEASQKIAELLYEAGTHPKIKSGDLYIACFTGLVVDDECVDAIGIFKSETKQDFLKVEDGVEGFDIKVVEGINLNKIDKACIIYNTEENFGYKINLIDNVNKTTEAQYWRNDFLGIEQRQDNFYQTKNYIDMCKDFIESVNTVDEETGQKQVDVEIDKPQQMAVLNKAKNYFKEKPSFNKQDFEQEVLQDESVIEAFNNYQEQYSQEKNLNLQEEFTISPNATKKAQSKLKGVLKLDSNFHIYIHGDENKIVRGEDPDTGMKYYKIYFDNEE